MSDFYVNHDICAKCGGKCCKAIPGAVFPEDIGLPDESKLNEMLASGNYAVDWWDGDIASGYELSQVYYLRPSTKNAIGKIFDPSWGGECVFLGLNGCRLQAKDRPRNCRELEPKEGRCVSHDGSKEGAVWAWRPYQEVIERVAKKYDGCRL